MSELEALSVAFEANRERLQQIAYRMLGSLAESEDAVQEIWLKLASADASAIENPGAWLTTVVSRIAVDMLRARERRREVADRTSVVEQLPETNSAADPEREHVLVESIGVALMILLDRLRPNERIAFVLHDMLAVPFKEIAAILSCSQNTARQFASRARRAARACDPSELRADGLRRHDLVRAFFAASRAGDVATLLKILDANVTLTIDPAITGGHAISVQGAEAVSKRARIGASRNAAACVMLIDGEPGIAVAASGRLHLVMTFKTIDSQICAIQIIAAQQLHDQFTLCRIDE